VIFYILVGVLLGLAALGGIIQSGATLWSAATGGTGDFGLQVLDRLLLVLMIIELLHTVRMSVRSQSLVMEPFLIVGIMASIRRVLVITMQAAKMTEQGQQQAGQASISFWHTMIELGLLGILILIFVFAIYLLRKASPREELLT